MLDSGKAIAALVTNGGEALDYLELIGRGQSLTRPAAPYIAIPTTAGTGAEVTRNAVLGSAEHRVKVSLRSPLMLPRLADRRPGADLQPAPGYYGLYGTRRFDSGVGALRIACEQSADRCALS